MKLLYYAHSMHTYGTRKEKRELKQIKKHFPDCEIINPADIKFPGNGAAIMQAYLDIIKTVDVLVFSEYRKHIGKGVDLEIRTAKNIEVNLLRKKELINHFKISLVDPDDWAIRYAEVVEV